jgi:hypothetical protein
MIVELTEQEKSILWRALELYKKELGTLINVEIERWQYNEKVNQVDSLASKLAITL